MAPRNISSDKSVVPSELRLRLGGINSSVDASPRHGAYQSAGARTTRSDSPVNHSHIGQVDSNSHQGTLGILDSHSMETKERGITWY
jgi:hypothetical protein